MAPADVPFIETERLILRSFRADDFAPCAAIWADPAVVRHTTGKPLSAEEVWHRLLRYAGLWPILGYGFWAVQERASGEYVGELGFCDFKRDLQPSLNGAPEIGWILASRVHGKGYASEAVRAAIAWGDQHFPDTRTVCLIHPENAPSIRLAEKFGFRDYARTTYKEHDVIMFERHRP
jgi:RimJ/RimL family protein N-acetyltransferase